MRQVAAEAARGRGADPRRSGRGRDHGAAARIADAAGLPPQTVDVLVRLWEVLVREDALLVEVNPLVRTAQGASWLSTERSPSMTTPPSASPVGAASGRRPRTRWRRRAAAKEA
ncbi:hypothetical protein LV779_37540 [Streptomyces thinghirensis]|nr:hypothetical protein [Streptomyces thinghirensis]